MSPVIPTEDPHPELSPFELESSGQENQTNEQILSDDDNDVANEYYVLGYN